MALDTLYHWMMDSDVHPEKKAEIVGVLAMLRTTVEHEGIPNWVGVYAGELLERAARDAAYELAKDKITKVYLGTMALLGLKLDF